MTFYSVNTLKIPILSHTQDSFAQLVRQSLGKGYQHACLVYQEWFRTGQVLGQSPAFKHAQILLQDILALTDFTSLPLAQTKQDGQHTGKFLLKTHDQLDIESVCIPMQAGGTLCVSSQIGCRMGCVFCETGRMGLIRHLTSFEIVGQVFAARFFLKFPMRNIVFMGMGEPFDNYDEVMQAVRVLSDPAGFGFGHQHITISTSGCIEGIKRLMEEKGPIPHLAVSINAPTNDRRNKLMPVNRKHNLQELYAAMDAFCRRTGQMILIAYVLIKELNDGLEQADELADYLQGLNVKINLIPYNPQSHDRYQSPDPEKVDAFTSRLRLKGYRTLLRQTKGKNIMAACGQLGNLKLRQQKFSSSKESTSASFEQ